MKREPKDLPSSSHGDLRRYSRLHEIGRGLPTSDGRMSALSHYSATSGSDFGSDEDMEEDESGLNLVRNADSF